mgnify:CR=1 FL=1
MDLNQLKQSWQHAGAEERVSTERLAQMTKIANHPVLGRIRLKLMIEAIAMAMLLFVFYDIFDGHLKPVYASIVLVIGVVFYLVNNLYSYFTLNHAIQADDVYTSLQRFLAHLQRAKVFSLTSLVLFSLSLLVFFASSISMSPGSVFVLMGMLVFSALFLYFSARTWAVWIGRIRQSIRELTF